MDKVLTTILEEVSEELGVDMEDVDKIYTTPYKYMRRHIIRLDLYGKVSEEIEGYKTNFMMPALFKLYVNKFKLDKLNKKER